MTLKLSRIKDIISEAYTAGYQGSMELRDAFVENMLKKVTQEINETKSISGDEWKVYTVEELNKEAIGTVFEHRSYGLGTLKRKDHKCYIQFDNGDVYHCVQNTEPWIEEMRKVKR